MLTMGPRAVRVGLVREDEAAVVVIIAEDDQIAQRNGEILIVLGQV